MTSLSDLQAENARLKALLADAAKALGPFARIGDLAESVVKDFPACALNPWGRKFAAARAVHAAIVREIGESS